MKMKNIIRVCFLFMALIMIQTSTIYLTGFFCEAYSMDTNLVAVLRDQLSDEEISTLSTKDYYDMSIDDSFLNYPILRCFSDIYFNFTGGSGTDYIKESKNADDQLSFTDYIVLSESPYSISVIKKSDGDIVIGQSSASFELVPSYISRLYRLSDVIIYDGEEYIIENLFLFDATNSYMGAVLYYETSRGALVEYYENATSDAIITKEEEFLKIAHSYYQYISSYENNYNAEGEPVGGSRTLFSNYVKDHIGNSDNKEANRNNKVYIVISLSIVIVLSFSIIGFVLMKQMKQNFH